MSLYTIFNTRKKREIRKSTRGYD